MDRRSFRSVSCNGSGKNLASPSPAAGSRAPAAAPAGSKGDAVVSVERRALLSAHPAGGTARKGMRGSKRRVQWKDRHGKKLIEVREFQPSDTDDSDDEYLDTCICSIM
ncbi:Os03g0138400 [Oryza sativa Japonica Group]|uniref:Os03g0138400 protein n=2 Tax=Oryza sativa subsp. japonica TaxID=39947 RepID=C7J0K5_ORYSJ|nr:hypothetical protein EE612_015191 [Oryza sativa]KAF2937187.1 hypothetical protein DAI22_03g031700 [Oryza sativa Japonica Group]BAH91983.1 Os03g0138400 [Oryza sativa Japonica Group]BAS82204.1 Os03g0138400 [Oryza sativa Japonica Group]|eukprot:NP_001173255.1 Os03g0138400 [Oryza sativa Japonica Group]